MDASEAEVTQFATTVQPLTSMLEADPQTAAFIEQIRGLKAGSTEDPVRVSCVSS